LIVCVALVGVAREAIGQDVIASFDPLPQTALLSSQSLDVPAVDVLPAPPIAIPSVPAAELANGALPDPAPKYGETLKRLNESVETLSKNLTITTADPNFKIVLGGAITTNFLYSSARPVAPGTPFFLAPGPVAGFQQQTFDATARPTTLFALVSGPEICGFQSSAFVAVCFYSSSLVQDLYGVLRIQAYAQLKNDDWRFAAGLQFDVFNPLNPTVLPFSYLAGSGNAGAGFPAQFRVERYLHLDENTQVTLTGALSDPISTSVASITASACS
jgi:hypothetical protein